MSVSAINPRLTVRQRFTHFQYAVTEDPAATVADFCAEPSEAPLMLQEMEASVGSVMGL